MSEIGDLWLKVLPEIRDSVTGVGVWSALNACTAVALEDNVLVLGLPHSETKLSGHLKQPGTRQAIETSVSRGLKEEITLRVIEGDTEEDWADVKARDAAKIRLQARAMERTQAELTSRAGWQGLYEELSRKFAATSNRSLPQNRAKFFLEAVELLAAALIETPIDDDLAERNFARCIERIAQYSDVPSVIVAVQVLEQAFEG